MRSILLATALMTSVAFADDDQRYRLQPGDVLQVAVWKETDLQGDVVVQPDGAVAFPLVGEVSAAGRTVEQLRGEIALRLKEFVPDPVVTVLVKAVSGNRIYVLGKVARPGDFVMTRPTDVVQALSLAGGTTAFADTGDIRILRREAGRLVALSFSYADVERGQRLEQNVLLQGGDTVIVP